MCGFVCVKFQFFVARNRLINPFKGQRVAEVTRKRIRPKTLTPRSTDCHYGPGPRTTYRPVHGLPLRTPLQTTLSKIKEKQKTTTKIKIKIKISLTACPIDHSCAQKFQALPWVNVTDLGSVSCASYAIADYCIFAIFFAVALRKKPGSFRNLLFVSLRHFVRPALSSSRASPSLHSSSLVSAW